MSTDEIDTILARQSMELLDAMQRGEPGAAENLTKWLKQSRRHTEHYLMAVAFERELNKIEFDPQLQIESTAPATNIVTLERGTAARTAPNRRSVSRWRMGTIAASLVAGIALLGVVYWQTDRNVYATAIGEQRAVELEDGSVIHLNTTSRVAVHFSKQARDIELLAGEALFKVHHDTARPFRVRTPDAVIQAIGTEFNVYRQLEGTTVAVLEGRVKVTGETRAARESGKTPEHNASEANLGTGQQVRIDHRGKIAARQTKDTASVAAWRQRRLIFAGTPLPEIVAEFNRYNRTPKFVLEIDDAAERRYSGVFDADDPESLAKLLSREPELVVQKKEDEIAIRRSTGKINNL